MKVITRDRLYKTNINIQGEIMKIIEYNNCDNIVVEFEKTKTKKKCKYSNFIIGSVKDDNLPYLSYKVFGKNKNLIQDKTKMYEILLCWKFV